MRTLQQCQDDLVSRGVRDVKFFFAPDVQKRPFTEVAGGVTKFLNSYLNGQGKSVAIIEDAVIPRP